MSAIEATYSKLMKQVQLRGKENYRKKEMEAPVALKIVPQVTKKKKKTISQHRRARVPVKRSKIWMTALKRL